MVGREFVPNEDMGEWTVHLDAPEGHLARGHERGRVQAARGAEGIEGVADIEPSIGVVRHGARRASTHIHFLCQALPIERAQEHAGADHHRDAAPARGASRLPPEHHVAQRARQRRRAPAASPISANILGPDLGRSRTTRSGRWRRRRSRPSLTEAKITLNVSNPEVHVAVDRKRAADLGVRMATIGNTLRLAVSGDDQISLLQGRARSSIRSRSACSRASARDIAEIGRLTVPSADRAGAHRQHRQARARPRTEHAAAIEPPVHRQPQRRRRAGACARRGVERRAQDARRAQHAADDVVPAAGPVEDPRRDDREPDHGHQPGDDLRLHGAGVAVRELPPADRDHAGAADRGAVRAVHAVGDRPDAEPVERARHAPAARHRQEELDPAGRLRQRPARAAACRSARRSSRRAARGCGRS